MPILTVQPFAAHRETSALDVAPLVPPCNVWPCDEPVFGIWDQFDGLSLLLCEDHLEACKRSLGGRPRKLAAR